MSKLGENQGNRRGSQQQPTSKNGKGSQQANLTDSDRFAAARFEDLFPSGEESKIMHPSTTFSSQSQFQSSIQPQSNGMTGMSNGMTGMSNGFQFLQANQSHDQSPFAQNLGTPQHFQGYQQQNIQSFPIGIQPPTQLQQPLPHNSQMGSFQQPNQFQPPFQQHLNMSVPSSQNVQNPIQAFQISNHMQQNPLIIGAGPGMSNLDSQNKMQILMDMLKQQQQPFQQYPQGNMQLQQQNHNLQSQYPQQIPQNPVHMQPNESQLSSMQAQKRVEDLLQDEDSEIIKELEDILDNKIDLLIWMIQKKLAHSQKNPSNHQIASSINPPETQKINPGLQVSEPRTSEAIHPSKDHKEVFFSNSNGDAGIKPEMQILKKPDDFAQPEASSDHPDDLSSAEEIAKLLEMAMQYGRILCRHGLRCDKMGTGCGLFHTSTLCEAGQSCHFCPCPKAHHFDLLRTLLDMKEGNFLQF